MTDYKILQNIDLAQNEIKEVSKISNDRVDDGSKKYIIIQTGDDTTLTLASKEGNAFNFIESNTEGKASSDEASLSSDIKSTPESIDIVHKRTDKSNKSEESKISLHSNAYTAESDKRNHILVQSPLVDIQTGESTKYDDSSIKLSKKNGNTLGDMSLKSNEITLSGGTDSLNSNISIEDKSINASSKNIKLSSDDDTSAILTLNQDTKTISSTAGIEIKETVDKVSISLKKEEDTSSQSITLSNAVESSSSKTSKIEVNNSNVKISKGDNSYTEVNSNNLTGVSSTISLSTSKDNPDVSLILNNKDLFAKLTSSGTITLTSQNEAKTEYGNNSITSIADTILLKTKGYTSASSSYPHIQLESRDTTKAILIEGKTISVSSADESTSNKTDSVNVTGTDLNIGSTTTNITSNTVDIKNGTESVLTLEVTNKKISVPSGTETNINSNIIKIGSAESSSTTIYGKSFTIGESTTTTINGNTSITGSTTINNGGNILEVSNNGTNITGTSATINPTKVNIGTDNTTSIYIGSTSTSTQNTTTLQSDTTKVTSPNLKVNSSSISFKGNTETQNVTFEGGTNGGTVKSTVPTSVENTTFTVKNTATSVLEVSAPDLTTKISGTSATINPKSVNIGTENTNEIKIGSTNTSTQNTTTLQSNTTNITSANISIGNSENETIKLGTSTSTVSITGNNGLSLTSGTSETPKSEIASTNMKFTDSLYCNDKVRIYWDSTLQSLVFGRV